MLEVFTLSNGIQVASYNLPQVMSVHLKVISKCGTIVETKENAGIAHFMEHMLVQGIPAHPTVEDLSSYVESLAGGYNASTSPQTVDFFITLPAPHLKDAVRISSEVFFDSLFVEDSVNKERQVIINELSQEMDSFYYDISQFVIKNRLSGKLLKNFTSIPEEIDNLKKLVRIDLINFWKKYFIPKNTVLIVVGNFSPNELKNDLEDFFGKYKQSLLPGDKSNSLLPAYPDFSNADFSGRKVQLRSDKRLNTCHIDLTIPTLNMNSPLKDRVVQNIGLVILGRLRNSRLYKLLRQQRGLVYSVVSGCSTRFIAGYVYISSESSLENLDEVIELVALEMIAFIQNGITKQEFDFAKNFLTNQWQMSFDHPSSIAGWLEDDLVREGKVMLPPEYSKLLEDVTSEDVLKTIQKYWQPKKMNLVVQGNLDKMESRKLKYIEVFSDFK